MPNEIHRKPDIAEFAVDVGASCAELDSLPDQDLCWSAPIATLEDCEKADFTVKIKAGTDPDGTVEIYAVRNGATNRVGTDDIDTNDHGTEGTTEDIARVKGVLGTPVDIISAVNTTGKVYTTNFRVWDPGPSVTLFFFNNTGAALDGTSSPHAVHGRGWLPEIQ